MEYYKNYWQKCRKQFTSHWKIFLFSPIWKKIWIIQNSTKNIEDEPCLKGLHLLKFRSYDLTYRNWSIKGFTLILLNRKPRKCLNFLTDERRRLRDQALPPPTKLINLIIHYLKLDSTLSCNLGLHSFHTTPFSDVSPHSNSYAFQFCILPFLDWFR